MSTVQAIGLRDEARSSREREPSSNAAVRSSLYSSHSTRSRIVAGFITDFSKAAYEHYLQTSDPSTDKEAADGPELALDGLDQVLR